MEDQGAAKIRRLDHHQCLSDALEFSPFQMGDLPEVKILFFFCPVVSSLFDWVVESQIHNKFTKNAIILQFFWT